MYRSSAFWNVSALLFCVLIHQHLLVASSIAAIQYRCPCGFISTLVGPSPSMCTLTFGAVAFSLLHFGNGSLFKLVVMQTSQGPFFGSLSTINRLSTAGTKSLICCLLMWPSR